MSSEQPNDHAGLSTMWQDSEEIEVYYDNWAEQYDNTLAEWEYVAPQKAAAILRQHLEAEAIILDAGCGTGLTGKALAAAGFQTVDGIDLSADSLKFAATRQIYRSLTQVNMKELPLTIEDNSYDGLECVGVLTYLPDSLALFREFCRIVRPGGIAVFTQRTDLFEERDFGTTLQTIASEGKWDVLNISDPSPYLPKHEEYTDRILIRYITCQIK